MGLRFINVAMVVTPLKIHQQRTIQAVHGLTTMATF